MQKLQQDVIRSLKFSLESLLETIVSKWSCAILHLEKISILLIFYEPYTVYDMAQSPFIIKECHMKTFS